MVDLERGNFIGRDAIAAEKERGSAWHLVGLEVSWEALEALYESFNLPPSLPATARRDGLPVYDGGRAPGRHRRPATPGRRSSRSTSRSPRFDRGFEAPGTKLQIEHTVEFERRKVTATVVRTPFYDPERKRKP